jgi:hypothetical protein
MEHIIAKLLQDFEQGKISRQGNTKTSFSILDPGGFQVQLGGTHQ